MVYIVFDLEATCWEEKQNKINEIIEIGAIAIDENLNKLGYFGEFVRPKLEPKLSDFCTTLTTIQQQDVDNAKLFPEVFRNFETWCYSFETPVQMVAWGFYDKKQIEQDCQLHQVDQTLTKRYISLKHQYSRIRKLKRPIGLEKALKNETLVFEGTPHRGIDDAINIGRIFHLYFKHLDF